MRHERHLCEDNSSPTAHAQIMGYIRGFMTGTVDDNKGIKWAILKENRLKLLSLDVIWN